MACNLLPPRACPRAQRQQRAARVAHVLGRLRLLHWYIPLPLPHKPQPGFTGSTCCFAYRHVCLCFALCDVCQAEVPYVTVSRLGIEAFADKILSWSAAASAAFFRRILSDLPVNVTFAQVSPLLHAKNNGAAVATGTRVALRGWAR